MVVICAGMYRSCSTWQYAVIADLLERHRGGQRLGYLTGDQFADWEDRGGESRPCVLKSHEGHARFTRRIQQGRAVVVYAHRDVRDVVYSLIHKRAIDFPALLESGMVDQILANDAYWSSRPRAVVQRYEEITGDPEHAIHELAEALGIALKDQEAASLAREHSLESNRERVGKLSRGLQAAGIDLADPANAQYYDPRTLLHWNHVRDGRTGGWSEVATAEERYVLGRSVGRWLIDQGYEADLTWLGQPPRGALNLLRWKQLALKGKLTFGLRSLAAKFPQAACRARSMLNIPAPAEVGALPAGIRLDTPASHHMPPAPRRPSHVRASRSEATATD